MKMYSLTEGEIGELAALRTFATLSFSVASGAFGFWLSVKQGLAFSDHLAPVVVATWNTWEKAALIAAGVLAAVGGGFVWRGHTRLNAIKAEMEHDA